MRRRTRHFFRLAGALFPLLILGAGSGGEIKEVDDGLDLYFRENDVLALADQALPVYPETDAGESTQIERDFPHAPPAIPHTLEDMYPIMLGDNECIECHHPDNTVSKEDAPLPESHFETPVMGKGAKGEAMVWVVKGYEKTKEIAGARYNCDMCHTPQAINVQTPNSRFVSARKAKEEAKGKSKGKAKGKAKK